MTPLVSQLWPQFMVDPAFASCFGQVIVERARMLRQERQVILYPAQRRPAGQRPVRAAAGLAAAGL